MYSNSEMIKRIKQEKKAQKITNVMLSELTGISRGTLNKILSGESKDPQVSAVIKIAKALNVSADYLAFGEEPGEGDESSALTKRDENFIKDYLNLSNQGKEYMCQTMDMVKEKYKKQDNLSDLEGEIG